MPIYFIQCGEDGPIKIGVADNPRKRLAGLQIGNPQELRLLAVVDGDRELEEDLHRRFESKRTRGEWFYPTEELLYLIDHCDRTGNVPSVWDMFDAPFAGNSTEQVETAGIEPAQEFPRLYIEGPIPGLDCRGLPCPVCDIDAGPTLRLARLDLAVCDAGHRVERNQYGELFHGELESA